MRNLLSVLSLGCVAVAEHFPPYSSPVLPVQDVFSRDEGGYYCIKIPYLTALPNGGLMALGEARVGSCSDYTKTDLVMKFSPDGVTWSDLKVFHSSDGDRDTIGNAAPVVVDDDIVVLFNSNNSKVLMKRSSDLGETWTDAVDISDSTTLPNWKWVGLGPPAGLQLSNGRLLIPAYNTAIFPPTVDNGLISKGHALLSDDKGLTWRISADHSFGGLYMPNEDQAVELSGGRVAIFSRGLGKRRTRTVSEDWGEHWGKTELLHDLKEPITGCEGSTIACPDGKRLIYAGPVNWPLFRDKMSIYTSDDEGEHWDKFMLVDPGASAYSALAWRGDELGLLYERSDKLQIVFEPDHISYAALPNPCASTGDVVV